MGRLDLETLGCSSTSSLFELPALGGNVRLSALEGTTEVPDGFSGVPPSSHQDSVGTSGGSESELVEGQGFTTVGDDSFPGGSSESQSGDGELGDNRESLVVQNGTDDDNSLGSVGVGALGFLDNSGDRDRRSVDLGHKQPLQDDSVELGFGSSSQESVELDQEEEIRVLTLRGLSGTLLDVVLSDVDTHLDV